MGFQSLSHGIDAKALDRSLQGGDSRFEIDASFRIRPGDNLDIIDIEEANRDTKHIAIRYGESGV